MGVFVISLQGNHDEMAKELEQADFELDTPPLQEGLYINYVEHKLLHAGLGAGIAALTAATAGAAAPVAAGATGAAATAGATATVATGIGTFAGGAATALAVSGGMRVIDQGIVNHDMGGAMRGFVHDAPKVAAKGGLQAVLIPNTAGADAGLLETGANVMDRAMVQTAIDKGLGADGKIGHMFVNSLRVEAVNAGAQKVTSQIGQARHTGKLDNNILHKGAHGLVGAGSAYLKGQNPLAGAAGAVAGEMVGEYLVDQAGGVEQMSQFEQNMVKSVSQVASGIAGASAGDVNAGLQAGDVAVENNAIWSPTDWAAVAADGAGIYDSYQEGDYVGMTVDGVFLVIDAAMLFGDQATPNPAPLAKPAAKLGAKAAVKAIQEGQYVDKAGQAVSKVWRKVTGNRNKVLNNETPGGEIVNVPKKYEDILHIEVRPMYKSPASTPAPKPSPVGKQAPVKGPAAKAPAPSSPAPKPTPPQKPKVEVKKGETGKDAGPSKKADTTLKPEKQRHAKSSETEKFSQKTQELLGVTDRGFKQQFLERPGKAKNQSALNAAKIENKGGQIPLAAERGRTYDHVSKVKKAQRGLHDHIQDINKRLSHPNLPMAERQALQQELSGASKLLDFTEKFVPRIQK